jgi:hypothetical protein
VKQGENHLAGASFRMKTDITYHVIIIHIYILGSGYQFFMIVVSMLECESWI